MEDNKNNLIFHGQVSYLDGLPEAIIRYQNVSSWYALFWASHCIWIIFIDCSRETPWIAKMDKIKDIADK